MEKPSFVRVAKLRGVCSALPYLRGGESGGHKDVKMGKDSTRSTSVMEALAWIQSRGGPWILLRKEKRLETTFDKREVGSTDYRR